jgi:hypothetical protein
MSARGLIVIVVSTGCHRGCPSINEENSMILIERVRRGGVVVAVVESVAMVAGTAGADADDGVTDEPVATEVPADDGGAPTPPGDDPGSETPPPTVPTPPETTEEPDTTQAPDTTEPTAPPESTTHRLRRRR